ncbi:YdhR family protein [Robiginitalea sp.]|uniref:YdhR family protein n=1 Tax=Robiginitalea sp. TaxID=1902411 RepID=UPI003C48C15C
MNGTKNQAKGTILLLVRGKTALSADEIEYRMKERSPQFEAIPGLIQKYYIKTKNPGEYGGVYIWDSMKSVKAFKETNLAATIAEAYELIEEPSTEIIDIMFELRD